MQKFVACLSNNLGLTGREIAEVIWLASQQQNDEVIEVAAEPARDVAEPPESSPESVENLPSLPVASAEPPPQADLVPPPVEQPSLALPPNYTPVAVPDAPAITQALRLARALRPLARQIATGLPTLLDEAATVKSIADTGVWQPVLKAEPELWLDVALIFDTSPSMCLWQRFGADLHRLLARYGEFRDVRIWYLDHQDRRVALTSRRRTTDQPRRREPRKPSELLTGDRRRLVVIVSDCVAPAWHDGQMRDLIAVWSAKLPTVIFQVFPERLWSRTALVRSLGVELKAKQTGVPSDQLKPIARSVWDEERVQQSLTQPLVRLPVVTLEREVLAGWAKMVAGDRQARSLGIVWNADPAAQSSSSQKSPSKDGASKDASPAPPPAPSLQDRLDTFILTASPLARQLATLLVSAPVITLPIIRLIKQANLKQVNSVHIAEVLMSGLLKVSGDHKPTFENAEKIVYELVDDQVRDRLRAGAKVVDAITVYRKVSEHIAKGLGRSVHEFWALLRVPSVGESSPETAFLNAFASVTAKVLRGLGAEFDAIADSLTQPSEAVVEPVPDQNDWLSGFTHQRITYEVAEYVNFPPLEPFEFVDARFDDSPPFPPPLETETFTVFTFEERPDVPPAPLETFNITIATPVNRDGQWQIQRQQSVAHRYTEPLPDNTPLEMVAIPSGTFQMGSPESEPERDEDESPQHEVTVQPFFIGRYPITQAQWRAVASLPQVEHDLDLNPSNFKGADRPVEQVSWYDAVEFCARLSAHTGREYRLPTEAEWEYACRAGTTTPFHFGETITTELANYRGTDDDENNWSGSYGDGPKGEYREETTPVNYFDLANEFGLSDMHGNVYQWCQDHWHESYEDAPTDGTAWLTDDKSAGRLVRGGSWIIIPRNCRSAFRNSPFPLNRNNFIGFRVVSSAPRILQ
ncbi:MAG: SAV_2336 N-terminal domain-related protein [Cyanobacteria bacterium J06648_16]